MAIAKKSNPIVAYFMPFGLKQLTDIMMLAGAIVLLVGIFTTLVVIQIGLFIYLVAAGLALFSCVRLMLGGINKNAPEYKRARVNAIVMAAILLVDIFGLIYSFFFA